MAYVDGACGVSDRVNIAALRELVAANPSPRYVCMMDSRDVLALVEAVEAAAHVYDDCVDEWERLDAALAKFDLGPTALKRSDAGAELTGGTT